MARNAKSANNIQVFRGSRTFKDVFAQNAGLGCCDDGATTAHDKLAARVRFDNELAHLNPHGANDKFRFPYGNGFEGYRNGIIDHINTVGVGAQVSVLVIPTYAFVTGVGIHVAAEEAGLTFNVLTRNGLTLPVEQAILVTSTASGGDCEVDRSQEDLNGEGTFDFEGIGAMEGALALDYFTRSCCGEFSLEADEIILEVASMPAGGVVNGLFDLTVSVSYDVLHRADY